jgi:GT2 family glycosyltransferase
VLVLWVGSSKYLTVSLCLHHVLQKHHYYLNKELTFWLHLWMCLTVFTFLFLTRRRKTKVPDGNGLHRAILQKKRDAVHHLQHITVDMYAEMAFFHFLQAPPNP